MRSAVVAAAVAIAATGVSSLAGQDPPVFRSSVGLVEVDVTVIDKDGQPVRGLTRDDFEILEEDRLQDISTLSFVDIPYAPPRRTATPPKLDVETDVTTNADPEGRVYVILLDAPSTANPDALPDSRYTVRAKQVAYQFVRNALQDGDYAAVVHARGTFRDAQGFTTSRRLIEASVERYGRGLSGNDDVKTNRQLQFNLDTYRAIEDISTRLGAFRARRRAIVWIGGQIDIFPERNGYNAAQAATLNFAYRDAIRAATRNNVAVYAVDPTGSSAALGTDEVIRMAGLRAVAEDTGGLAIVNTSNFDDGFAEIVRDVSSYYLLGYTPAEESREGTFRSIRVRVTRPDVTVRARTGYYAGGATRASPARASLPSAVSPAAAAALARPVATRGLKVSVVTTAFKSADDLQPVVIGAHIDPEGLSLAPNAALTISYQLFTDEGRVAKGHYRVYRLDLRPETRERAVNAGLRFLDRVTLRPGRYELRLVAEQPGVALGSVVSHLDVADVNTRLDLSGIVLGKRASGTGVMLDLTKDDALADVMGGDPAVMRRFKRTDTLLAFVESYTELPFTQVGVAGTLHTLDGRTIARVDARPADAYANQDRTGRGHLAAFDLSRLEPGDHVLVMTARAPADLNRVVTRQVRLTIVP